MPLHRSYHFSFNWNNSEQTPRKISHQDTSKFTFLNESRTTYGSLKRDTFDFRQNVSHKFRALSLCQSSTEVISNTALHSPYLESMSLGLDAISPSAMFSNDSTFTKLYIPTIQCMDYYYYYYCCIANFNISIPKIIDLWILFWNGPVSWEFLLFIERDEDSYNPDKHLLTDITTLASKQTQISQKPKQKVFVKA